MQHSLELPYGKGSRTLTIREAERVNMLRYPGEQIPTGTGLPLLEKALLASRPRLKDLALGKRDAVIVISDRSRLCPSSQILPLLLEELHAGGLQDAQIQVVVALGKHRRMTEDELRELTGDSVYQRLRVVNHSALPDHCVLLGHTSRGTPVEVFASVARADLRIAVGNPEQHRLAGVSGGVKALLPGVASSRAIEHNHGLSRLAKAVPGDPRNPVHEDLEEAHRLLPFHYFCNPIVNHRGEVLEVHAGAIEQISSALVEAVNRYFTLKDVPQADLVVASAGGFPKDMQLYQAVKALQNAAEAAKPGAPVLLVARCEEGYGNGVLQDWIETIQDPKVIQEKLERRFVLGAHKLEHIQAVTKHHPVTLVSDLPPSIAVLCGFQPAEDLQAAYDRLSADKKSIAVIPHASLTFITPLQTKKP